MSEAATVWAFAAAVWLGLLMIPLGSWLGWSAAERICRWHDRRQSRLRWEATREAREASSRQCTAMLKRAIEMRLKMHAELLS